MTTDSEAAKCLSYKQARQESNLQPPVLEASLPSPPKTRPLPNCPCKTEIARAPFRARLR